MERSAVTRPEPLRLESYPNPSADHRSVDSLLGKFRPLGRTETGDLLLAPDIASHLAIELAKAFVGIMGVGVWLSLDGRFEELYGVDLSGLPAKDSLSAARDFLARWQPDGRHLFSLITRQT
jgi:hypothetical protein